MFPPAKKGGKPRTASTGFFDTLVQDARTSSADTIKPGDEDRVFYKLAVWKRIIIMLGGPTMNLLIAIVLYAIVLCGFGIPQHSTTIGSVVGVHRPGDRATQTECTDDDSPAPAAAAGLKPGDRFVSIDGIADRRAATRSARSSARRAGETARRRDRARRRRADPRAHPDR